MKTSQLMQHYQDAKDRHPGMMLLFQMGDFYETFGQDAENAARTLGLCLTRRGDHAMAGFPRHRFEEYVRRLLDGGFRVAVCEQVDVFEGDKSKIERVTTTMDRIIKAPTRRRSRQS